MRKRVIKGLLSFVMMVSILCGNSLIANAAKEPTLEIIPQPIPLGKAGRYIEIPIQLRNTSNYIAKDIVITPVVDDTVPLSIEELNIKKSIKMITPKKKSEVMTFKFLVKKSAKIDTYPMKFKVIYKNTEGSPRTPLDEILYFKVTEEHLPPKLTVKEITFDRELIKAGEDFTMNMTIKNLGTIPVENTYITLEPTEKIGVVGYGTERYLLTVKAVGEQTVSFRLKAKEDLESGSYPIVVNLRYDNGGKEEAKKAQTFYIDVKGQDDKQPANLMISELTIPKLANTDETFTLSFAVENKGMGMAKDIEIEVGAENESIVPVTLNKKLYQCLQPGSKEIVQFSFKGNKDLKTQNYPIKISLSYKENDSKKAEKITLNQYAGIYINGKKALSGTVPILIVSNYKPEPQIVKAGDTFDLSLDFWNTSTEKEVRNMKVTLTVKESSETSKDDVFTPENGNTTFYVASIEPNSKVTRKITMFTVPDAQAKTYKIQVNFDYEYENNGEVSKSTSTDVIGIPVVQPSRLEYSSINTAVEYPVEQGGDVSLEFYNTGKVKLINLMIKMEVDDPESIRVENGTYYVGNFEVGNTDFYEASVIPSKEGEIKGKIIFTYEDPTGKQEIAEQPFVVQGTPMIEEEPQLEGIPEELVNGKEQEKVGKGSLWIWIISGSALLVLVIIIILLVRRKKRRDLSLNEDF